jgi:hypothetical protein
MVLDEIFCRASGRRMRSWRIAAFFFDRDCTCEFDALDVAFWVSEKIRLAVPVADILIKSAHAVLFCCFMAAAQPLCHRRACGRN